MRPPTTTSYALLGLLAIRPWTGYELTRQAKRSLHFAWPRSEANVYDHQQERLVELGWATVDEEEVGQRTRKRYAITEDGRQALRTWLASPPDAPHLEIEGVLRLFFADQGEVGDAVAALQTTATATREDLTTMLGFVDEYLDTGGAFPERLHLIALAVELVTDLLSRTAAFAEGAARTVANWETTRDIGLDETTHRRLERIRARHGRRPDDVVRVGTLRATVVDVGDLDVGASFWSAVTGLPVVFHAWAGRYSRLGTIEEGSILLQLVPETKGPVKNRVHLDITVEHVEDAVGQVVALGGSLVTPTVAYPPDEALIEFAVVADPFGNEFCLIHQF